jgi:hypothetical protein
MDELPDSMSQLPRQVLDSIHSPQALLHVTRMKSPNGMVRLGYVLLMLVLLQKLTQYGMQQKQIMLF